MDDMSRQGDPILTPDVLLEHPLPETMQDAEKLAASIERAVWQETCGGIRSLRVRVQEDGVLLTGRCKTFYAKQQAQQAAMGVRADCRLTNRIEVF